MLRTYCILQNTTLFLAKSAIMYKLLFFASVKQAETTFNILQAFMIFGRLAFTFLKKSESVFPHFLHFLMIILSHIFAAYFPLFMQTDNLQPNPPQKSLLHPSE